MGWDGIGWGRGQIRGLFTNKLSEVQLEVMKLYAQLYLFVRSRGPWAKLALFNNNLQGDYGM